MFGAISCWVRIFMWSIAVSFNVWTIHCSSKCVNSRYGMSSSIIKDIKYHILRSLTLDILKLLPQTSDSFRVLVCAIYFLWYFLIFGHILWKCAPTWWPWEMLMVPSFRSWLVLHLTKFHINRPKKYRNSGRGGTMCPPPPTPPPPWAWETSK